ncbi:MAG: redox-regulated ATPase YchF, partial [Prolixibacteraceae bacterium]
MGNSFLADIRDTDALIHVLRCFDDDNLIHIDGSVDPLRDLETLEFKLQVRDITSVEKKIQRTEKLVKAGVKDAKATMEALQKVKQHLESFNNVRDLDLDENEKRHIQDLMLL